MSSADPDRLPAAPPSPAGWAAPLAGVTLTLLALWIAAMPRPQHAVALTLGAPCPAPLAPPAQIHVLRVAADNAVYWDGVRLPGRATVEARLQAIGALVPQRQAAVRIEADSQASYGAFMAVLAAAQRLGLQRLDIGAEGLLPLGHCTQR